MSNTVTFHSFDMADNTDALTVEGVFQKYASFGGLQGFEFEDQINAFDSAKWTANGLHVNIQPDSISTTAAVSETIVWYSENMPHSYVMEFTFHTGIWGAYIRADGGNNWYRIRYDNTGYISLAQAKSSNVTMLYEKELSGQEIVDWGRARISVRDAQASSDSPLRILYISVWVNDNLVMAVADNNANFSQLKMGLMINQNLSSSALIFSDFRVADLGEVITISSLDPGEKPIDALQRALEDRYVKFWVRWNGKLKALKPKARTNALTISPSDEFSLSLSIDKRQLITHARVLGAFQWVQVMDDDLIRQFGHRFRELQNTSAWNTDDCRTIGQEMILRSKEQAFQARLNTYGLILLEIEDRIQASKPDSSGYTDYIIDSISLSAENGTLQSSFVLRQYFYGEP